MTTTTRRSADHHVGDPHATTSDSTSDTTSAASPPADGTRGRAGRRRRLTAAVAGLALGAATLTGLGLADPTPAAAAPIDLDENGRWSAVEDWPMIGIHAALDRNGRVVTYGTNPDGWQTGRFIYDIWTPSTSAADGHNTLQNTTQTDLFCSLQINRADTGDMLLFGGDNWTGYGTNNRGNPDINQLDAATGQLSTLPGMQRSRWYATGITMPDGTIYVQGGLDGEDRPELWSADGGSRLLDIDTSGLDWYYPRNFLMPDGRVFGIAADGQMYYVSADFGALDIVGRLPVGQRGIYTTAVMFEPGKILWFGGDDTTAVVIDVTGGGTPVVTESGDLSGVRHWVNGTLLPDGRVLATGGSVKESSVYNADPINTYGSSYSAEIWDPATGQWTIGANAAVPRLYHSTALLLPDGRILSAGGGAPGPIINTNAEIYSPDYLVAANGQATPRLSIDGLSDTAVSAGQRINVAVSSESDVVRATLVQTGSVTHSFNMTQRFVELAVDGGADGGDDIVTVSLPVNDAEVPPGFYLLSLLDENDIPSVSQMIHVTVPNPDAPAAELDGQIIRLYQAYVQRNPDQAGFLYWRRSLLNGLPLVAASDFFAQSAEFTARYGTLTDEQFVDQIYTNVLGRAADDAGRDYWVGQLGAGITRGEVMLAFSESAEFIDRTGTGDLDGTPPAAPTPIDNTPPAPTPVTGYVPEVHRLYVGYFLRAPDESGLTYWTGQRAQGVSLAAVSEQFAQSAEFVATYGAADDQTFVDLVYRNVLDREADADGQTYWVGQLGNGVTRGEIMAGFTESAEFVTKVGPIG
ncbi:MAG: DUF4214 domain-containing protein [Actinomycetota bacterium]